MSSGNSFSVSSDILIFPGDISSFRGRPFIVDFGEDVGDEAQEGVLAWKDADLGGSSFDFLLDGTLHEVGCAHPFSMGFGQGEDRQAFRHIGLHPSGEVRRCFSVAFDPACQGFLGIIEGIGVPDPAEFRADPLFDGSARGVVDGVLSQMELAALPNGAGQDGLSGADSDEGGQWIRSKPGTRFDRKRPPDSTKPDSLMALMLTVE